MRNLVVLLLILAVPTLGGDLRVGEVSAKPSKRVTKQARAAFQAAREAFEQGDYERAIEEFRHAYELFPDPEFFFNIGEAYRKWGKREDALVSYRKYLELDEDGRAAELARNAIAEIEAELAEAERVEQEAAVAAAATQREEADPQGGEPAPVAPLAPSPTETSGSPGRTLRWAGIGTGGLGVVALGAGVYFGLKARSLNDQLDGSTTYDHQAFVAGERANQRMIIASAVGAGAVLTGAVLFYFGSRQARDAEAGAETDPSPSLTVAPAILQGGEGMIMSASGSF